MYHSVSVLSFKYLTPKGEIFDEILTRIRLSIEDLWNIDKQVKCISLTFDFDLYQSISLSRYFLSIMQPQ